MRIANMLGEGRWKEEIIEVSRRIGNQNVGAKESFIIASDGPTPVINI